MKRLYRIKYIEGSNEWHLLNPFDNDAFIMNLPDCANFRSQADEPDRDKEELYIIDIHRAADTNRAYPTEGVRR